MSHSGRLVVSCPDRPGIVAAVSDFLFRQGANIVHSDQHSTHDSPARFFMRVEFEGPDADSLAEPFGSLAARFEMDVRLVPSERTKRLAVFASKEDHCLQELLWQVRSGDLRAEIAMVVSNHENLSTTAESFGVPFHHVPVSPDTKSDAEVRHLELLEQKIDLVVLARYMQILSPEFLAIWGGRVINIHHSFLPAFAGARPYHQAYERGVKIIGATAHYVTADLDAGPIIEQDVHRVDHGSDPSDLMRIGRQTERAVLARAVRWHVEDRVLIDGSRTVVFD
jgi:formyltetrahydrofolate deformylase